MDDQRCFLKSRWRAYAVLPRMWFEARRRAGLPTTSAVCSKLQFTAMRKSVRYENDYQFEKEFLSSLGRLSVVV